MSSGVRNIVGLMIALAACFAVAGAGSAFTISSLTNWYPTLKKPSFNPPNAVFGPVWSLLYTMMAVAAWIVWRRTGMGAGKVPLSLFAVQLVLNFGWSVVFFGLRSPGWAFAEVLMLWASILATLIAFWRVSTPAGVLMVPYLAWVSFASALNFAIWRLNS